MNRKAFVSLQTFGASSMPEFEQNGDISSKVKVLHLQNRSEIVVKYWRIPLLRLRPSMTM